MSKQLTTSIEIQAAPDAVWQVLTGFLGDPDGNPFIIEATGEAATGARLTLRMQPVVGKGVTLRPAVREVVPGTRLRWLGRFLMPGLMDAEHVFELEPIPGGTRLHQSERFTGLLVPFLASSLDRGTLPAFGLMNAALKSRAEAAVAAGRG